MEIKLSLFVNQIGYGCTLSKYAYATGLAGGEQFSLVDSSSKSVFTGIVEKPKTDRVAGEPVCCLDFSGFQTEGTYFITVTNSNGKTAESS